MLGRSDSVPGNRSFLVITRVVSAASGSSRLGKIDFWSVNLYLCVSVRQLGQTQSEVRLESSPSCSRDTLTDLHQQPSRPLHLMSVPQSLQFFVFDNGHSHRSRLIHK
jgi:hypothetical protein